MSPERLARLGGVTKLVRTMPSALTVYGLAWIIRGDDYDVPTYNPTREPGDQSI